MKVFDHNNIINIVAFIILLYLLYLNLIKIDPSKDIKEILYGILLGYQLGGFASGIMHWFMDSFDYDFLYDRHYYFREHHLDPTCILETPLLTHITEIAPISFPFVFLSLYTNDPLIIMTISVGVIVSNLSQIAHRYAHLRNHENDTDENGNRIYPTVPNYIRPLQDSRILLNNEDHAVHHSREVGSYCIAHSNADKLFDYIIFGMLNMRASLYAQTDRKVTPIYGKERLKYVNKITLSDVINEQLFTILATVVYLLV